MGCFQHQRHVELERPLPQLISSNPTRKFLPETTQYSQKWPKPSFQQCCLAVLRLAEQTKLMYAASAACRTCCLAVFSPFRPLAPSNRSFLLKVGLFEILTFSWATFLQTEFHFDHWQLRKSSLFSKRRAGGKFSFLWRNFFQASRFQTFPSRARSNNQFFKEVDLFMIFTLCWATFLQTDFHFVPWQLRKSSIFSKRRAVSKFWFPLKKFLSNISISNFQRTGHFF